MTATPRIAVLVTLAIAATSCKRHASVIDAPLAESFTSPDPQKVVTIHYPKFFAASVTASKNLTLTPTRDAPTSPHSELFFSVVATPATNDPVEFTRILREGWAGQMHDFKVVSDAAGVCFGAHSGVEVHATYTNSAGEASRLWSCNFLNGGHAYAFGYMAPESHASEDEPLLKKIVAATEIP